jgi:hypothetical protein
VRLEVSAWKLSLSSLWLPVSLWLSVSVSVPVSLSMMNDE